MNIQKIYSDAPWEKQAAYCRAKKMGPFIAVAGTTAVDVHGEVVFAGDTAAQAKFIFEKIDKALESLGASLQHTIRTRMFVTELRSFDALAAVHRHFFEGIDPAASCIQISGLVDPRLTIEIEPDAVLSS